MPSQSELDTTKQYDFSDDPSGGGQLMSKKVPRTEAQPQVITYVNVRVFAAPSAGSPEF